MKAVVYKGFKNVAVEEIEMARIEEKTDVLLRITSAAICGSDLHMYDGRTDFEVGRSLGHEIMGVIEKVGDSVTQIKVGDRVVLPFNIACGDCFNCTRMYTSACLTMSPKSAGAGYGYADMGPYQGGQAEYIRVPHADFNCLKVPGTPGDEFEDKFILLADIFPTAYHSTELAKVEIGGSVAIYGAGPVGMLAALSSQIKGASEIYVIDSVPERLEKVKSIGATPQGESILIVCLVLAIVFVVRFFVGLEQYSEQIVVVPRSPLAPGLQSALGLLVLAQQVQRNLPQRR